MSQRRPRSGKGRPTAARPEARGAGWPKTSGGAGSRGRSLEAEIRAAAGIADRADRAVESFERARDLLAKGRAEAAARAAEAAKGAAPRSTTIRELLGIALYGAGRYREALQELLAYRRMSGRLDENHLIADCYRAIGSTDKAIRAAREGLDSHIAEEARAESAIVGASALADEGRFDDAIGLLRSFRASRSNAARAFELRLWYVAGDVLERAGRPAEAVEEFRRIVRHDPSAFDAPERLAALEG